MLWQKYWREGQWRFLTGLVVLICSAASVVISWPTVIGLLPLASNLQLSGEIGRRVQEAVELERDYRGYVWVQWFRQHLPQLGLCSRCRSARAGWFGGGGVPWPGIVVSLIATAPLLYGSVLNFAGRDF